MCVLADEARLPQTATAKLSSWAGMSRRSPFQERPLRHLRRRPEQHLRGQVETNDFVTALDQMAGVAAGATGRVERPPWGQRLQQRPDRRLLKGHERVSRLVIALRPRAVPGAGTGLAADLGQGEGLVIEKPADLGQAFTRGVVAPLVQPPKQREPLDAYEQLSKLRATG